MLEETRRNETPDGYIMAWLLVSSYMLTTVLVLNACVVWIMFCDISKRCGLGIIHDSFGFGSLLLKDYCDGESKLNDSSCVFVEPKNDAEIDGLYGNCGIKLGGKWSMLIRHILWNFKRRTRRMNYIFSSYNYRRKQTCRG